jgi:dienelactone hydrolase
MTLAKRIIPALFAAAGLASGLSAVHAQSLLMPGGHARTSDASAPESYLAQAPALSRAQEREQREAQRAAEAVAAAAAAGLVVRDAEWQDTARNRTLPVRIYVPREAQKEGLSSKLPLVVFSHGLGGSRMGYSQFGRHFAEHGMVALHVQHSGSDRAVWQSSGLALIGSLRQAASEANAMARAQDVSFAITALLADAQIGPLIDPSAIAVAGHSYGANTALLLAGATVERDGQRISLADKRIKAAILMSAPPFHGERDQAAVLRDVRIPTLHVTGTDDDIRIPGYRSDVTDRIGVFRDLPKPANLSKHLVIFEGGDHSVFTDRTRSEKALSIKAATRDLSIAFLNSVLREQPGLMEKALEQVQPLVTNSQRLLALRPDV